MATARVINKSRVKYCGCSSWIMLVIMLDKASGLILSPRRLAFEKFHIACLGLKMNGA